MGIAGDNRLPVTPYKQQAIGDPNAVNTALIALDAVIVTFLGQIMALLTTVVVDKRRKAARDDRNNVARPQVVETLAARQDALKASAIIDTNVCRPACLDGEDLQIIRHITGRCVYNSMIGRVVRGAIALDHRFEEDPDRVGRPLAYHGGYALVVSVTKPGKEITERQALGTDAAVPSGRQVCWQSHCPDCIGHLVEDLTTILCQDNLMTVDTALRKVIAEESRKGLDGK